MFTVISSTADSLRDEGDLEGAIVEFGKIYANNPTDQNNIYNFACALSVMGKSDSAFKYLHKSIEMDTSTSALTDPDFIPLRKDKRWGEFENKLIAALNIKFNNPYKDIEYAKTLWRMQALDQAYYGDIEIAEKKIGMKSSVVKALWELKHLYNEKNQQELEKLIDTKGWPKISNVGNKAAGAAFLIIQHSDYEKQKKYLPTIEKLCTEKEASWQSYALMYDRIQTNENKPQKYGSQIKYNEATKSYELFPLLDETKVDEWRKEIGMRPLSEYVARWNIKFEPKKK
jgi:hypothetical protein